MRQADRRREANGDPDASAVYAAEEAWCHWLDTAADTAAGSITVDGLAYTPEVDPRFVDPEAAGAYVERVLAHLRESGRPYGGREGLPVQVRSRRGNRMAHYTPATMTIALPSFEVGGRWSLRAGVALHELAHHLADETGHGAHWRSTFLRLLEDIGSTESARLLTACYAVEGLDGAGHTSDDSTLTRIAKLLRQAERTSNDAEKQAFFGKAQALATRNSIALAVARAHGEREERREEPVIETCRIGQRGQRGLARYVRLLINIAHANDLKCTISGDSTAVQLHGFASDIAVTRALYESLVVQMVAACERHLATTEAEIGERFNRRTGRWEVKPVATITRRIAFYEAFGERIGRRLDRAREEAVREATVEDSAGRPVERSGSAAGPSGATGGTALALRQKEVAVHDFFAESLRRNNIRGSWSGDRRSAAFDAPEAADAGSRSAARVPLGTQRALD
ncbi:MAG: DUF2786 domain-containing protein [Propionibacteriaceae bacterium]